MTKATTKWLIDTDIGDDIDDALAIKYALKVGLNVVALTTVFRASRLRARLAKYFLKSCGFSHIPVYAGEDNPLQRAVDAVQKPERWLWKERLDSLSSGEAWLPHWCEQAAKMEIGELDAPSAIIKAALASEGELGILALAPLTNIALALKAEPSIAKQIRQIVMFGGNISSERGEWNILLDPDAALIVLESGIAIKMIGSDLSWSNATMDESDLKRLSALSDESSRLINQMLASWHKMPIYIGKMPCLHDALPIAALVEPQCIGFEQKFVCIDRASGVTSASDEPVTGGSLVQVARSVDRERFWASLARYCY